MIRNATHSDIPAMIELGEAMHHESPRFCRLRWNGQKVAELIGTLIDSADGLALVADRDGVIVGGFIGVVFDHWCTDERCSTDFALFVPPALRGGTLGFQLLRRYTRWAKASGVPDDLLECGITTGVSMDRTTQLFKLCGFKPTGTLMTYEEC